MKEYKWNQKNIGFDFDAFMEYCESYIDDLESSGFKFNLKNVFKFIKEGFIHIKNAGYGAFLVFKYWDEKIRVNDKIDFYNEDYEGLNVKDKIKKLNVTFVEEYIFEGYYGTCYIHTFKGEDDRKYKWFTSSSKVNGDHKEYMITSCSIKEFEDSDKYGKAIVLTRCRIKEV